MGKRIKSEKKGGGGEESKFIEEYTPMSNNIQPDDTPPSGSYIIAHLIYSAQQARQTFVNFSFNFHPNLINLSLGNVH